MVCSLATNDNIYDYISNMGKNLTPNSRVVGHKNVYILTPHFKFVKREKNNDDEILKTKENYVDSYDYLL